MLFLPRIQLIFMDFFKCDRQLTITTHNVYFVLALCCRSFHDHTLVFLQTKRLAHKLRIILGLHGLKVAELHGDLTQLQVFINFVVIELGFFRSRRTLAYTTLLKNTWRRALTID